MSPLEIAGVCASALAIVLTARRKMACWPVGLVSVLLYAWIFFDAKLYSDMLLQGAFAIMQLYGWWGWLARSAPANARDRVEKSGLPGRDSIAVTHDEGPGSAGNAGAGRQAAIDVQPAPMRGLGIGLLAGVAGSVALGFGMSNWTDAALPWVDASLSAFSLVAQFWTARRYLASWQLWIVVDCIYVGLFAYKALYATAVLYAVFVVLALLGWRDWSARLRQQRTASVDSTRSGGGAVAHAKASATSDGAASLPLAPGDPGDGRDTGMGAGRDERAGRSGVVQFGILGEQAERDWPLMIESEVGSVLSSYRIIGEIDRLAWHSPRPFAAAALVTMSTGETLFVKRHHRALRTVAALGEEHRFIAHLAGKHVPVVQVLGDRLGRTAIAIDDWTYEVHLAARGVDIYRDAMSWEPFDYVAHARAAGRSLARLHRASAGYVAPAREPRLLVSSFGVIGAGDPVSAAQQWVASQPILARALAARPWRRDLGAAVGPHHARLLPHLARLNGEGALWTHGDWHASNLLWSGAGAGASVVSVLDFGLADRTCAVYDLALAIERNTIGWLADATQRVVQVDQVDALLDGYAEIAPLSPDDLAALVALLPIVHIEFALSEVGYFAGVLDLPESAEVAYEHYFLGHIHWFESDAGRMLLDRLASRAA